MRFGIMGAGSIGCYLGGRLVHAGYSVNMVGRLAIGQEIAAQGLKLTDFRGFSASLPPERLVFSSDVASLKDCDVVFLTVKSLATTASAEDMRPHLRPNAIIISLQNGIRNPALLRASLPTQIVLAGMVPFNVIRLAGSRYHQGTSGQVMIEKSVEGRSEQVVTILNAAGLSAAAHPELPRLQWGKLLINLSNAVNALAGVPLKEQMTTRGYREIVAASMQEGLAVLHRAGCRPIAPFRISLALVPPALRLPTALFSILARQMVQIDPEARSSMWEDLERRKLTEIDFLNGEIVRLADSFQLPVPINQAIVSLVRAAEQKKLGSPLFSVAELKKQLKISYQSR